MYDVAARLQITARPISVFLTKKGSLKGIRIRCPCVGRSCGGSPSHPKSCGSGAKRAGSENSNTGNLEVIQKIQFYDKGS